MFNRLGIRAPDAGELPPPGESSGLSIRRAMRNSDFVCAILPAAEELEGVFVEIGAAIGLNKPLFLIIAPEREVPFVLQNVPSIRSVSTDVGAIEFHLRLFLKNAKDRPRAQSRRGTAKSVPGVQNLGENLGVLSEREFEDRVGLAGAGRHDEQHTILALSDRFNRGVNGVDLIVAWCFPASIVVVVLKDDLLGLGVQALPPPIARPQIRRCRKSIER